MRVLATRVNTSLSIFFGGKGGASAVQIPFTGSLRLRRKSAQLLLDRSARAEAAAAAHALAGRSHSSASVSSRKTWFSGAFAKMVPSTWLAFTATSFVTPFSDAPPRTTRRLAGAPPSGCRSRTAATCASRFEGGAVEPGDDESMRPQPEREGAGAPTASDASSAAVVLAGCCEHSSSPRERASASARGS